MKKILTLTALLLSAGLGLAVSRADATTFKKIADTTLTAPDGYPVFIYSQPQLGGTSVIFMGATGFPESYIFRAAVGGGTVSRLVDGHTKVPGGTGTFTGDILGYFTAFQRPNCSPPVAGTSSGVFVGRDAAGNEGLYSVPLTGGNVIKLADRNTPIPGGPVAGHTHFDANYTFCNVSISGNVVAFDGGQQGVYTVDADGTHLARVADGNTPATPPPAPVSSFSQPSVSGSVVTYIGSTVYGPYGVYVGSTTGLGKVAVRTTNVPQFNQFTYPIIAGSWIDFTALLPRGDIALYRMTTSGGTLQTIANLSSKVPPQTPGTKFVAIGSPNVYDGYAPAGNLTVFHATTATANNSTTYAGLFTNCRGTLAKVLADGDRLGGVTLGPLDGASNLLAVPAHSVTQYYEALRVGGGRYQAIYVATIPAC